ncbi:XtrA/YqaO family protein [Enterococcus rotai]|uniref:XtrA/YqaO family protein n=1 Tax=Enterococcus rotai TaxID=118060 RepID=UPI0035C6B142
MNEVKRITIDQLKNIEIKSIENKVIICSDGQLFVADLPEHGLAGIRTSNNKYQRIEYSYTVK